MSRKKSSSGKPGPFASLFPDDRKSSKKRKRRRPRRFRFFFSLCVAGLVVGAVAFFAGALYFSAKALTFDMDKIREVPQRTMVFDRDGETLGHVTGHGENRLVVPASEVSANFITALLAREDSRFYDHNGVDFRGLARAFVRNITAGGMEQGASTLTMQLARNTYGMREMSIQRKLQEIAIARRIERNFSKDEILGFYMNRIYFGSGLYGI